MNNAWITLSCPDCDEQWEADPAKLPAPDATTTCQHCGSSRPTAEFTQTKRDLEILQSFE